MAHSLGGLRSLTVTLQTQPTELDDGLTANDRRRIRPGAALFEKRKPPCEMGVGVQERRAFEGLGWGELAPERASG
jgi:hypothetical protein